MLGLFSQAPTELLFVTTQFRQRTLLQAFIRDKPRLTCDSCTSQPQSYSFNIIPSSTSETTDVLFFDLKQPL
ncbi:hypothetical protein FC07_GL003061 [Loigolactobacillus bifermentans DSM 20003]|uniref:Uncharacterized protein n=1 Tax=Loigolactobacillus bifermentans DSM 20003 TaxID=1423726 RepID=A0A0R1H9G0_9LACO|nr:hypothetical protein FC07_GL003061 [Loigolactobacillus bifermentans DSM 20003]